MVTTSSPHTPTLTSNYHLFSSAQDLDGDNIVSKEELSIFLRHLFSEQVGVAV